MLTIHIFVFLTAATHQLAFAARKDVDQIVSLPGLTYDVQFKQYSGYLQGTTGVNLHYWLVESQSATPSTDPLILWLNGGPGCSSVKGLIKELGPFHPNPDGVTLFENVYSWNKKANVLFVEMPKNTGFSFQNTSLNNGTTYNDETTGADTLAAVKDFFDSYPEYRTRDFYVMGVSYGGVYVPLLTNLLIKEIQAGRLTANLVGIAIGNGQLKVTQIINSNMVLLYAHGLIGKDDWDSLQKCCPNTTLVDCDFSQWLTLNTDGVPYPVNITTECGGIVADLGLARVWATLNNVYNIYQDCYQKPATSSKTSFASSEVPLPGSRSAENAFIDQGSMINWASTDAFGGYSCYADSAAERFLNTPIVRDALHIPSEAPTWQTCSEDVNQKYIREYLDTTSLFDFMIGSGYKLKMLIYNGDVDTACNFLAAEWFIEELKTKYNMTITETRHPWYFQQAPQYSLQLAGYQKSFGYRNVTIDLVTVKGSGHYVPMDRPGPALQMITNFINNANYSTPTGYSITRAPLLSQYQRQTAFISRSSLTSILIMLFAIFMLRM